MGNINGLTIHDSPPASIEGSDPPLMIFLSERQQNVISASDGTPSNSSNMTVVNGSHHYRSVMVSQADLQNFFSKKDIQEIKNSLLKMADKQTEQDNRFARIIEGSSSITRP